MMNSAWPVYQAKGPCGTHADSGCANAVGEPCEGNPHARFDEGRGETRVMPGAPRLLYYPKRGGPCGTPKHGVPSHGAPQARLG